jgi:hypothetical protein
MTIQDILEDLVNAVTYCEEDMRHKTDEEIQQEYAQAKMWLYLKKEGLL